MKISYFSTFCLLFNFIICAFYAQAQSPSLVNFRGQLLNSTGQPVTSTVSVDLRVFPSENGGAQLYLENIGNVEVINGLYAFQFGSNGSPDFTSVIRQNSETWVEITLNGDVLPRQRFVSVPYALSAGNAQVSPGSITREMLSQDVQLDLNQSTNIAPGSITREMLAPGVLVDGNGSQIIAHGGGGSIDNPFGWDGEYIIGLDGDYVVPEGKVLIITSLADAPALSFFKIEDNTTETNTRVLSNGKIFLPSGEKIIGNSGFSWSGCLVSQHADFEAVVSKGETFTVPTGKLLVMTSSTNNPKISSGNSDLSFRSYFSMSIIPSGSSITCNKGAASVTFTSWSGYLTDQESLANLGGGSSPSSGG